MTIDTMKIIGTLPSGFAGSAGFSGDEASCTRPRSTLDKASAVTSRTTLEITKGSRAS